MQLNSWLSSYCFFKPKISEISYNKFHWRKFLFYAEHISLSGNMMAISQVITKSNYIANVNHHHHHHIISSGNHHCFDMSSQQIRVLRTEVHKNMVLCVFELGPQLHELPKPFHFRCSSILPYLSKDLLDFLHFPDINFWILHSYPSTKRKGRVHMRKQKVQKPQKRTWLGILE